MAINIRPVTDHREREKGVIVYPVYSRRSEGLSIGINLFPDRKSCAFNCPYCEVFHFSGNTEFSLKRMEDDLKRAVNEAYEQNIPVKDICFSGNGEPTLSPFFCDALKTAEKARIQTASSSQLVIITNGTGLLNPRIFSLLKKTAANPSADIWLKLDAGTPEWYQNINRSAVRYGELIEKIKAFASCAPVTIQTMLCAVNSSAPPEDEVQAWENLVCGMAVSSKEGISKVQLYGKARPAPEDPLASGLPDEYLEKRASSLRSKFAENGITAPVKIFF